MSITSKLHSMFDYENFQIGDSNGVLFPSQKFY